MSYDVIKALHLISVMSWMAGLLYLPRLFVYHAETTVGSVRAETFKVMERRLLKAIMNPAMIISWITGFLLVYLGEYWDEHWFWAKFACVVILSEAHFLFGRYRKAFEMDRNIKSEKFFRIANEVPTVVMIAIVIFVVIKPF